MTPEQKIIEEVEVANRNIVKKIMPGINLSCVRKVSTAQHNAPPQHYRFNIFPKPMEGVFFWNPIDVSATILQHTNSPHPYVMRDMVMPSVSGDGSFFGRVHTNHNLIQSDTKYLPQPGTAVYHDYATATNFTLNAEGALVSIDDDGNTKAVDNGFRLNDGDGTNVSISNTGIVVRLHRKQIDTFAVIPFHQSAEGITVGGLENGVLTYVKELHFS